MKTIQKIPNFQIEKFEIVKAQDGDILITFLNRVIFPDVVKTQIIGNSIIFPRSNLPSIELVNILSEDIEAILNATNVYISVVQENETPKLLVAELEK